MLRYVLATLLAMTCGATAAQASNWIVDTGSQTLEWTVGFNGNPLHGRFGEFTSQITFDPANLAGANAVVTVQINSVSAETDEQAQELVKPEWFDADVFPTATFVSQTFQSLGGDDYEVVGTLKIRDQAHPIAMPITFSINGDTATITGETAINRTNFGVGQGDWSIDDVVAFDVAISFSLNATRAP